MQAISSVAVIGAGLIGTGWATVFCRAGLRVRLYDEHAPTRGSALEKIDANLEMMRRYALVSEDFSASDRAVVCDNLEDAVTGIDYVQESVIETLEAKRAVSSLIDRAADESVFVGSSSSGIPASAFTEDLPGRARFLVVHPVNPPHIIPLVELVPAPWTAPGATATLSRFMESVGQRPITVRREVEGFVLNRLQGALLNEAWALYAQGYASIGDIDRTVKDGLGLRWSFMGPFETIDLNAPGGIGDYAARLAPLYHRIALERTHPVPWPPEAIARAENELRACGLSDAITERSAARDERLLALVRHKQSAPPA